MAEAAGYREAAGRFATGVAVVTSLGPRGPAGLTTNAFASLSLEPLLAIVCIDRTSRTLLTVRESRRLAVNVLAAGQRELAHTFAGKASHAEKFGEVEWREVEGVPVLDGVVAWLAGDVRELLAGGDHEIAVVEVRQFEAPAGTGPPLVFYGGAYRALGEG